ncbi:MAG: signal peptidase I [Lachnospiraceae bacterium]|nr:signal peptidase I [Lachnospiraceae bacterium]
MDNSFGNNENQERYNDNANEGKRSKLSIVIEILIYVAIIIFCVKIVPEYIIQRTIVDGSSMESNYNDGDNLFVEKVTKHFKNPDRFDVIVFYPNPEENDDYYIKRVIGLPGETVQITGDDIYINGELLEENYGKNSMKTAGIAENGITLGKDEFFVLGDNRKISLDSRYEEVGPVKKANIGGRAVFRVWPFSEFGPCP